MAARYDLNLSVTIEVKWSCLFGQFGSGIKLYPVSCYAASFVFGRVVDGLDILMFYYKYTLTALT
ncbi:MAG: hypothetical protein COB36_11410 [Alphaproteobacteria bacterium]|nr:MAG: hypothetical protein COB36_11410 [Alphaproteobacteria bacterium]